MRLTYVHRLLLVLPLILLPACGDTVASRSGPSTSDTATADLALEGCPATFPVGERSPWVPSPPTTETDDRLAPDADPVGGVVCRYDVPPFPNDDSTDGTLAGEKPLTAGLARVRLDLLLPAELDGQDRVCTLIGSQLVPHLVRLDYADGSLWLSSLQDANSCQASGNGAFVTSAYLGQQLARSYDAGAWVAPPPAPPGTCLAGASGRAGQERALLPDGWTSLTVCRSRGDAPPYPPRLLDPAAAARVAAVLAGVEGEPGSSSCSGPYEQAYTLLATYDEGPAVSTDFSPDCLPALRNGSLDGEPTATQTDELRRLLAG